ncbi:MAG TPA: tRNA guanosine(34) transglycosylase Tgt [Dehalococcoidales bacterium]|nr:tRNA guanosine(34) transglycosylase Tgt [Dehalococcoidales bacterium]
MSDTNWFNLIKTDAQTGARLGRLKTPHGEVLTPVFMPVGSQATVKGVTPQQLGDIGIKMILCNNYHLYLRPGVETVQKMGGLHRFMHWDGAILTDSGGFQIFSLARLREIDSEGVKFRSHIDGSEHFITPELATQYQEALGADVIMALDICPSHQEGELKVREAMDITHRWALRCLKAHRRPDQALFGIIQGGFNPKWRLESVNALTAMGFAGYAVGGLSLGEPKEQTRQIVQLTCPALPENKARYLMGVGSPEDILFGVECGVDMFDCVLPTRVARNGAVFSPAGRLNIRNARWKEEPGPLDAGCSCYLCRNFSAAYLHHLFRAEELLGYTLATLHNLTFLHNFMHKIREAIAANDFEAFKADFLGGYQTTDENIRLAQKQKWLENRQSLDKPG